MGDVRRIDGGDADQVALTLDDLAREGARRMIATALEAEEYVGSFVEHLDEQGTGWCAATAAASSGG